MTDREALLRGVLLNPADDLPRLVFADWLDEHGESERAEFIRVGCELAKTKGCDSCFDSGMEGPCGLTNYFRKCSCGGNPARNAMRVRETKLLSTIGVRAVWVRHLEENIHKLSIGDSDCVVTVSRGFVDRIELPTAVFLEHAGTIFREHPVMGVTLSDKRPLLGRIDNPEIEWTWCSVARSGWNRNDSSTIPPEIWTDDMNPWSDDEKAVRDLLSRNCLTYGRRLAGLEPNP